MSLDEIKLGGSEEDLTFEQEFEKADKELSSFLRHYGAYVADQLMPYVNKRLDYLDKYEPENSEDEEKMIKEVEKLLHVKNEVESIYNYLKVARQKLDAMDIEYFWAVFKEAKHKAIVLKLG